MINIIIPVHNRLNYTKQIINSLRGQEIQEEIKLIVINDGSSDGTKEWLKNQTDIETLYGNGNLLWGGAIELGLKYVFKNNVKNDWILLINNDVLIDKNYVQNLLNLARKYYPAVLGSIVKSTKENNKIISAGIKINPLIFSVNDFANNKNYKKPKNEITEVDVLSGRGTLYPAESLKKIMPLKIYLYPHYFADYIFSLKVKKYNYKLLLSNKVSLSSDEDFLGKQESRKKISIIKKVFSRKSTSFFIARIYFWWFASNKREKISLPLRLIISIMLRGFKIKN